MMEELAAYASMGAASVALDAGLLFSTDDDSYRGHGFDEPNFYHKKLTSLKRRADDEDEMIISLLETVWGDELVACIAESGLSKKPGPGSAQPESYGDAHEAIQSLKTRLGQHGMFQNVRQFTSSLLGKRPRFNNFMTFANGFRSVSDQGNDSSTLGKHVPDSGSHRSHLYDQSNLLSLQKNLLNQQRELINQIRQTSERLEHQFRLQSELEARDSEPSVTKEAQAEEKQEQ